MANQKEYSAPGKNSAPKIFPLTTTSTSTPLPTNLQQANSFAEIASIYESEGWPGLFAGLSPRLVRAVASGAVQFASYEVTQNILNKL